MRWSTRFAPNALGLAWTLLAFAGAPPARAQDAAAAAATNDAAQVQTTAALMAAWSLAADPRAMPVENLAMPLDHHANGRPRAQLKAARALVPTQGYIRAHDVVIEMYDERGRLEGVFLAENCIYDRVAAAGYCAGKVRIERLGLHIAGVDMVWHMQARSARILSQAEVRADRFIKGIGGLFK